MAGSRLESKTAGTFVLRCVAFGIVMAFANILPYLRTCGAYETDGLEVAGWPFRCWEFGGFGGYAYFHPWKMAENIAIAVSVSAFAAWVFRHGVLRTLRKCRKWLTWGMRMFHKFRTWGTPYAE
jgi:hypothetical protein